MHLDESNEKLSELSTGGCPTRMTLTGRLRNERQRIEERLTIVNKALEILDRNPDIAKIMDDAIGNY